MKKTLSQNSRQTVPHKILGVISAKQAEKLLLDLVNLPIPVFRSKEWPLDPNALKRIRLRHPRVFSFMGKDDEGLKLLVGNVQHFLRLAWDAPDSREREWNLFMARFVYVQAEIGTGPFGQMFAKLTFPLLPDKTPFEGAMFYLTRMTHRMQRCPGSCPAPYFLKTKKGQKFCSPECADPSRRESKLRWYHDSPNSPKNR
jgi:hypothetical protein